jgi:hypothetical protein
MPVHPSVATPLLTPTVYLGTLLSNMSFPQVKSHTHIENNGFNRGFDFFNVNLFRQVARK